MQINDFIINESAKKGNLFLVKYFLNKSHIPINILAYSSVSGNIELVGYILGEKGIDVNSRDFSSFFSK